MPGLVGICPCCAFHCWKLANDMYTEYELVLDICMDESYNDVESRSSRTGEVYLLTRGFQREIFAEAR